MEWTSAGERGEGCMFGVCSGGVWGVFRVCEKLCSGCVRGVFGVCSGGEL